MKQPVTLTITPDDVQSVRDGWIMARQRDFSGGENLSTLPEKIARNQFIRMENAIVSPEGELTDCWQMDTPLFTNVTGGIVLIPIPGSRLMTVFAASGNNVVQFNIDPQSPTPYDLSNPSGYPGYVSHAHASAVSILGISHGTPFLGKNFCCASTGLYFSSGALLSANHSPLAFGDAQNLTNNPSSLIITNNTASPVTLTGAYFSGSDASQFAHSGSFPQTVAASGTYTFSVSFNPTSLGDKSAVLNITNNLGVMQITLSGSSLSMLAATPDTWDFGSVRVNFPAQHVFSVANSGPLPVTVASIPISGPSATDFSILTTLPITIPAGGSKNITVVFTPSETGLRNAVASVAGDSTFSLSGTGT